MRHQFLSTVAISCIAVFVTAAANGGVVRANDDELVPTGKGWGERPAPEAGPGQGAGQGKGEAGGANSKCVHKKSIL